MVNTDALQQVIDRINQLVTDGEITPEEGQRKIAYARSQADQASEETEEVAEEVVESEEGEVEEVEEEEVIENEEGEVEEVVEDEEVVEEEKPELEDPDEANYKRGQYKRLENLLEKGKGDGDKFSMDNLTESEQKRFQRILDRGTVTDETGEELRVVSQGMFGNIEWDNGYKEPVQDILKDLKNLDEKFYYKNYIFRDGKKIKIYDYENGVRSSINPEVTDEELINAYMDQWRGQAFMSAENIEELSPVDLGTTGAYRIEGPSSPQQLMRGEDGELITDKDEVRRLVEYARANNGKNGEYGPTFEDLYIEQLKIWAKDPENELGNIEGFANANDPDKRPFPKFKSVEDFEKFRDDFMKTFIQNNSYINKLKEESESDVKTSMTPLVLELENQLGYFTDCDVDPDNCFWSGNNFEEYQRMLSVTQYMVEQNVWSEDPVYEQIINTGMGMFDELFAEESKDFRVSEHTSPLLKFGFDTPLGYWPAGKSIQSMLTTLGMQFDKGEFARDTEQMNVIASGLENLKKAQELESLDDNQEICVKTFGYRDSGERVNYYEIVNTSGDCKKRQNVYGDIDSSDVDFIEKIKVGKLREELTEELGKRGTTLFEDYFDIKNTESLLGDLKTYETEDGWPTDFTSLSGLLTEQAPMMAFSFLSLGSGPALAQYHDTTFNVLEKEAMKRAGIKNTDLLTSEMLLEVINDDDWWNSEKTKNSFAGLAYGAMEFIPSKMLLKFGIKSLTGLGTVLLRGGLKRTITKGAEGFVGAQYNMMRQALLEGTTEFAQELVIGTREGREMDLEENFKLGFTTGYFLPGGISIVSQTATEVEGAYMKYIVPKLKGERASYKFFNWSLKNANDYTLTDEYKNLPEEKKKLVQENIQTIKDLRDTNQKVPENVVGPERREALKLLVRNKVLEKKIKDLDENATLDERIELEANKEKLKQLFKDNKQRFKIREGSENWEQAVESVDIDQTPDLINIKSSDGKFVDGVIKPSIEATYKGVDYDNKGELEIALAKDGYKLTGDQSGYYIYKKDSGETIVILDEDAAVAENRIAVGDHEIGIHALMRKTFEQNPGVAKELATQILGKIQTINPKLLKDSKFAERLSRYGTINEDGTIELSDRLKNSKSYKENPDLIYEEVLAIFAEGLKEGEIRISDPGAQDLMSKFSNAFRSTFASVFGDSEGNLNDKFEFNSVDDFIKFVKNTQRAVSKGEFTPQMEKALQGSATGSLIEGITTPEATAEQETLFLDALNTNEKLTPEIENQVESDLEMIKQIQEGYSTGEVQLKTGAETTLENAIIKSISPTVLSVAENRTKALYDPIPANLKQGLSRQEFKDMLINDMNLMVLREWDPSKQTLEKFIVNRGFLRAMNAASRGGVKQEFTVDITGVNKGETDTASWADPTMEEVVKKKKISPLKLLGKELAEFSTEKVINRIKERGLDINNLTYKEINQFRDLAAEEVAAYFGVATNKIINAKDNLTKEEYLAARMIINRDADQLLGLMPEGFSQELGIATGVPNTLLNKFYTKGEKVGNLVPWTLRKDISRSEFLEAFGIRADGSYNAKADGQVVKALMQLMNANVSNEIIGNMEGITDQGRFNIKTGGSVQLAALSPELEKIGKKYGIKNLSEGLSYNTINDLQSILSDDAAFQYITPSQTYDLFSRFLKDEEKFLAELPKEAGVIKDYVEGIIAQKTDEGKLASQNFKEFVRLGLVNGDLDISDLGLRETLLQSDLTLTDAEFRNDPDAQENYMAQNILMAAGLPIPEGGILSNERMFYGMLGSYGAGRIVGHTNANLKAGKDGRPPAKYMSALTKAFNKSFKNYEDYKKNGGYLTEETYNAWKNLDYDALGNTYEYKYKNAYSKLSDPNLSLNERKKIILDNFSSEGGKAQLEFLNLQMKTMQEYIWSAEGNKEEFAKRAGHVIKLLSTSSQLTSGVRLYADPNYFYIPEKGEKGKVKFEHLMSANEYNKNAISLILSNQWGKTEKSADVLSQYNGIYGYKDKFDIIDQQGKTNTSLIFRMGRNLEIAKNTYTLSSGLTETVYDEMKRTIGEEALRDFERDAEAIYNHNNSVVNVNGLGSLVTDTEGYEYSTNELQVEVMSDMDNTVRIASDPAAADKGITVADFDDTVALSNSKVIYTLPDGTTGELNASDFAKQYGSLQEQGAEFNFDQFNEVVDGKPGPMLQRIKDIASKYGTDEVYILTARDPKAAEAIQLFLKAQGLDLPIENIVGLADGTAAAKGRWVLDKTGEGYNNWYFTDDQIKNVDEVKRVLNIAARSINDMKVDTQLSLAALSPEQINTTFNRFLETSTGIGAQKTFSEAKGKLIGKKASRKFLDVIMPYSAEDFKGLLYTTLASGQEGEAQFDFYKKHLIDPYNKAVSETNMNMVSMSNDYRALKKQFKNVPKTLNEQSGVSGYTIGDAMRVYMWSEAGYDIPGLSKTDQKRLNEFVMENEDLVGFSQGIITLQKNRGYPEPGEHWVSGNVATDIIGGINSINRSEALTQWQNNVDVIFSKENMSKLEAAYGPSYVSALKSTLARMKSGKNRLPSGNPVTDNVLDWINNSVGNVMFLNTRSAALQTLSSVNFINWGDNNVVAAGKAFANQKQYWSDFMTLMNSDYLVQRRDGLKINVTESEIADAVKDSKNKFKAATAYMLNKGFVFTRYADSFAIASGGATFYRNRLNTYLKEGFSETEAQQKAFDDFYEISEETQQSADPSKISQQQSSNAGRIILAFANTPMQYGRLQKRAAQDLMNGRGDWKTNVSKLAYYGVAQNIMFNSLQQALFTEMFEGDDDELEEKGNKMFNLINGMTSSNLRGLGITGAAADALKNTLITIAEESGKRSPQFDKAISDLFDIAPPIDSKLRKLQSAANTFSWNRKEMKEIGVDIDNPALLASAQVISAMANIPMDRALMKLNNLRNAMSDQSDNWQKVALLLGYSSWELGLPYYGVESKDEKANKEAAYEKRKEKYQIEIKKLKKDGYKKVRKKVEGAITVQRPTEFAKSPTIEYWIKK